MTMKHTSSQIRVFGYRFTCLIILLSMRIFLTGAVGQVTDSIALNASMAFLPDKKEIRIEMELPSLSTGDYLLTVRIYNKGTGSLEKTEVIKKDCQKASDTWFYTLVCRPAKPGSGIDLDRVRDYTLEVRYRIVAPGRKEPAVSGNEQVKPAQGEAGAKSGSPLKPYIISTFLPAGPAYLTKPGPQLAWIPTLGGYTSLIYSIDKVFRLNQASVGLPNRTKLLIGASMTGIFWISGYIVTAFYTSKQNRGQQNVTLFLDYDHFTSVPLLGFKISL